MENSKRQEATSSVPRSSKRKPPDDTDHSCVGYSKRQRMVGSEANCISGFTCVSTMAEPEDSRKTHFSSIEGGSRGSLKNSKSGSDECKSNRQQMDRCTRLQCWVVLKRLMIHPDGFAFKKPECNLNSDNYQDSVTKKPIMGLEAIQNKLHKGMYSKSDEFADDVRCMLSNVQLYGTNIRGIHRMAMKMREEFEKRWESMKEKWVGVSNTCSENNAENKSSKNDHAPISVNGEDRGPRKKFKKPSYASHSIPKSAASDLRKSDTDFSDRVLIAGNGEDCGSQKESKKLSYFSEAESERKKKEEEEACKIKKEKEALREALWKVERTVETWDHMKKYEELEELLPSGHSILSGFSLKSLGLYLKD